MVFPALVEEGDDPVGELAEGHRIEGRGVEPVDDEGAVRPPIRSRRSRVAPSAAAWAGSRVSAACSISSPTKVLLRSFVIEDRGVESRDDWSRLR
jgi:hypothetical protein